MSAKIDAVEAYLNQVCWLFNNGKKPIAEISKLKFFASKALEFVLVRQCKYWVELDI